MGGGAKAIGIGILVLVALLFVGGLVYIYGLSFKPVEKQFETEAVRQSQQYRSSMETKLLDKMNQWHDIQVKKSDYTDETLVGDMTAQQNALLVQMHTESQRLNPDQVPDVVKEFLTGHPVP